MATKRTQASTGPAPAVSRHAVALLIDEARFDAEARGDGGPAGPADVWPVADFAARGTSLRAWVAEGARAFLLLKRPPTEAAGPWGPRPRLWLVGVLESPRLAGARYVAPPNRVPITDLSKAAAALSFGDHNLRYRIDEVFKAPRLLEPDDEELIAAVLAGEPTGTPLLASPASRALVEVWLRACRDKTAPREALAALLALPAEERARVAVDLMIRRRTGAHERGNWGDLEDGWSALLGSLPEIPPAELCALLREIGRAKSELCGRPWRLAWDEAQRHVAAGGMSPELFDALRAMQRSMSVHASDKNARVAIDEALFFAEHLPIDPAADAASVVQRTLRAARGKEREALHKLLLHAMDGSQGEPRKTWITKAEARLRAASAPAVRAWLAAWLAEIAALPSVRLSRGGATLLRGLCWLATLLPDPATEAALIRLGGASFARGKDWSPQHDRFIGGLAYALGTSREASAATALRSLDDTFGKTTARYAIDAARKKHLGPALPSAAGG